MNAGFVKEAFAFFFNRRAYLESVRRRNSQREYQEWLDKGKPVPPPHIVKQMAVLEYAGKYGLDAFIETGTYLGEMVEAVAGAFKTVYSIELNQEFLNKARKRLSRLQNVTLLHGDSTGLLPQVLAHVKTPCLFWLDGHYSGGLVKGDKNTPIVEELLAIARHPVHGHVVLIDDARLFTGNNDYPTLLDVSRTITSQRPEFLVTARDDIIRICRPE
jgi:hypothetical protein